LKKERARGEKMKIYVSGLYSGTNPQPGVGIARSLRKAYPEAELIGVEYSIRCSGIHWHEFDDIWLQRPWDEISFDKHADDIRQILDSGAYWISSIDLEIIWFADVFPTGHPNLLTPPRLALQRTAKPAAEVEKLMPVNVPPFVTTDLTDWELHAFCRKHDWKVWLKGPYYEAFRTPTWAAFQEARAGLSRAWATQTLFLQSHVSGYEESICFSAYQGQLIEAVWMKKRDLTELNKTWAGDVSRIPEKLEQPLRSMVSTLKWTGGAELEMVRDANDKLWLLEVNPRFPAWIHGSTITGYNLPAKLVEAASGEPAVPAPAESAEFTRVVLEIPVKPEFPLSPLPEPLSGGHGHSLKHPSGLPQFANSLRKLQNRENGHQNGNDRQNGNGILSVHANGNGHKNGHKLPGLISQIPLSYLKDLSKLDLQDIRTPSHLFLKSTALDLFCKARRFADECSTSDLKVSNAYSIKTNPDERLIKLALDSGFYAESISLPEAEKAIKVGFDHDRIILNGPAKWWRKESVALKKFKVIFCDSIEELEKLTIALRYGELEVETIGIRLRTPTIYSRFGIPIDSPDSFQRLFQAAKRLPKTCGFGVHFHMASSSVGLNRWEHLFRSMLRWCCSLEALSGRSIDVLDIGGGWFPEDLQTLSSSEFRSTLSAVRDLLPRVREIVMEPGKALAQPSMALAMQILEIRKYREEVAEAVVDGSIAELPMYFFHPHRILYRDKEESRWQPVGRGKTNLLGRLCMEHDVVATNVKLPTSAEAGDLLIFCDAGAYDRSMSYVFGCG
jgi:diaminopimelate decarboxylase